MITEEDAREQVLQAASSLFYRRGIQAVGMDAVRAEAGVSLKRIYSLFPSKDDLVEAVLELRSAEWDAGIADAARAADTPREKLLAVFDFLQSWFDQGDFRGCAFINSFGELGGTSDRVAGIARRQKASFQRYVTDLVRESGGPDVLAHQVVILAEGAQASAAISGGAETAQYARSAAEELIDHALGPTVAA